MAGPGFGTPGTYTPLQLIAGSGLLNNEGIKIPDTLRTATTNYNQLPLIKTLQSAITLAGTSGISASNITAMKSIGSTTVPALGSSVPSSFQNANALLPATPNGGFGQLVLDNANLYVGSGSIEKFCQAFQICAGYRSTINELLCSSINATTYLGPTFTTMNDLISGYVAGVNLALKCFGRDVSQTGTLLNFPKLPDFGEPATLLQSISDGGGITSGTLSCIAEIMLQYGLTQQDLIDLATPEASTRTLTQDQFNALQKRAYEAMTVIEGACLEYVTTILGVVTPDINVLSDLLDPQKIFPTSWPSMTVPATDGTRVPIYNIDGSINPEVYNSINDATNIVLPSGCDDLAKIVPPEQAAASKAMQASLQQIGGIETLTGPQFAAALLA